MQLVGRLHACGRRPPLQPPHPPLWLKWMRYSRESLAPFSSMANCASSGALVAVERMAVSARRVTGAKPMRAWGVGRGRRRGGEAAVGVRAAGGGGSRWWCAPRGNVGWARASRGGGGGGSAACAAPMHRLHLLVRCVSPSCGPIARPRQPDCSNCVALGTLGRLGATVGADRRTWRRGAALAAAERRVAAIVTSDGLKGAGAMGSGAGNTGQREPTEEERQIGASPADCAQNKGRLPTGQFEKSRTLRHYIP